MITTTRIEALVQQAEDEGIDGDIQPVLERGITAGELIQFLQKFNPETPIEVEIPVEIVGTDEMTSEAAYVIAMFDTPGQSTEADVITLRGCKPDLYEEYQIWESDENNVDHEIN